MEYFMASGKHETRTRVIVERYDKRYIVELPYSGGETLEELFKMILAIGILETYTEEMVLEMMKEFAEENLPVKEEKDESEENL